MTDQARAARNEYRRRWYQENKEKAKAQAERYWERRAAAAEQAGQDDNLNGKAEG